MYKRTLIITFALSLLFVPDQAFSDFSESELNVAQDCLIGGVCDPLVQCPRNRACFNNCDIGFDSGGTARKVGQYFASFFGMGHLKSAEGNYQVVCRGDCITNLVTDCKKEQPLDITITPTPNDGDPARLCREYCGAALREKEENYNKCEWTCGWFDRAPGDGFNNLTECYRINRDNPLLGTDQIDPKTNRKVCDPLSLGIINSPDHNFQENKENVKIKMRGFAQEALCQIKPSAQGCGSDLCATYPWARSCEEKQRELQTMMQKRKQEQEQGIIDYSVEALKTIPAIMEASTKVQESSSELLKDIEKSRAKKAAEKAAEAGEGAEKTPEKAAGG